MLLEVVFNFPLREVSQIKNLVSCVSYLVFLMIKLIYIEYWQTTIKVYRTFIDFRT